MWKKRIKQNNATWQAAREIANNAVKDTRRECKPEKRGACGGDNQILESLFCFDSDFFFKVFSTMFHTGVSTKLNTGSVLPSLETRSQRGSCGRQGSGSVQFCPCRVNGSQQVMTCYYSECVDSNFEKKFFSQGAAALRQKCCSRRCDWKQRATPQAVLMAPVENFQEHNLDGGLQLQVKVMAAGLDSPAVVEFQLSNCYLNSPILHWGLTQPGKRNWRVPSKWPEGTRDFNKQALQTPFRKSDDIAFLKIEVFDSKYDAIEFILKDDSNNQWYKFQGGNFRMVIPEPDSNVSSISIPEELVQVQSYLRWERNGKQSYTKEQEKEEYKKARMELQEEVAKGTSIDSLRLRLLKSEGDASDSAPSSDIPEELIQVQSYVRWEKAGKPTLTAEQQLKEFEEARKDLQKEIANGVSAKDLYKKLLPNGTSSKGKGTSAKPKTPRKARIERKKRDFMGLISSTEPSQSLKPESPVSIKEPTPLELAAQNLELGESVEKKQFKFGENSLLVLVAFEGEKRQVWFATDVKESLVLHWAVSKETHGQWQAPPDNIHPSNSTALEGSCESYFNDGFSGDPSLKSLNINVTESGIIGIPFVLRMRENWIKNSGSDFYISLEHEKRVKKELGNGEGTAKWLLDEIADRESDAERSFMHRFNIATDVTMKARDGGPLPLAAILVWMRFMATRQLVWNKNYNVKPREISAAQDRLTGVLQNLFRDQPAEREIVRLILSAVGRGGKGDVGQRIRDEILVVQRKNDCKGGMMEEWHQKLHNNTSPDDVVICQALLDYIKNDLDVEAYWKTLKASGVTKERLRSYDRPIVSEPRFRPDQKEGLTRDLTAYLKTLKAVHSGADLESAIATCMGYSSKGEGFMGGVKIHPISGLSSELPALLEFVLDHVEDKDVIPLLEGLLESRCELRPALLKDHDRLVDITFLDLALDSTVRTVAERGLEGLSNAAAKNIIYMIIMVLENLCLSTSYNQEPVYCLKEWSSVHEACVKDDATWPLRAKAVLDRTRLVLADKAEEYLELLQPSAEYLGNLLGVEQWAIDIFTEEIIRSGSAASLSQLLNRIDPALRAAANLGNWQVISPVDTQGYVEVVTDLGDVQDKKYSRPTILVANRVKGEEEIPDGAVAVLTPDMPDVLSHVSVRARNGKICFATCFDAQVLSDLQAKKGAFIQLKPSSSDLVYSEISDAEVTSDGGILDAAEKEIPSITLKRKTFGGKYAVAAADFNNDLVGAKSRNITHLKNKLPSWIKVPTSVALPFGVFEEVLAEKLNKGVALEIKTLEASLKKGDLSKLPEIREAVLGLKAPEKLVEDLKLVMKESNMPWPGDEGEQRWEQAWTAIKKVWASKWNERAYFSTRKAKIDHNDLSMAVLVQEIVRADYAFVIHTTNPSNEDSSEIYAEVVKGLGETLVGAFSGRALSFVAKKTDLKSPQITGYPSKRVGLFIKQSIIFRSDSNGEDLEGYAGAGLYDSVPMDVEEERVVDYASDPLVVDSEFQKSMLSKIAEAGAAVEKLYGTAQDIEGVIKDGELYLVQTRPQM
ncbi:hypothetical protein GOP47_0006152 [Adiantum capillus-veneris]|uniref:Pyruvate phosphate dikinase AMP/ATP-binding domain-containing protein n=1 Tax=Adiantum capillus-veneris TaxID=13818 RepID=A0A9D4V2B3_ADICA|nr:hypothetical protein GOP47_0006152 [Adiantum capillus-veneris]